MIKIPSERPQGALDYLRNPKTHKIHSKKSALVILQIPKCVIVITGFGSLVIIKINTMQTSGASNTPGAPAHNHNCQYVSIVPGLTIRNCAYVPQLPELLRSCPLSA